MTVGRFAAAVVALILAAAMVVSCGGAGGGGRSAADSVLPSTSAPPTEGPTTEAAGSSGGGASISLPSLPIGGNVDAAGAEQCAQVNWLGPRPIPGDVTIALDGFSLDPAGVFRFGGSLCGSDSPICRPGWRWATDNADIACLVPVVQVAGSDQDVTLVLGGRVTCAEPATCAAFESLGGSQITFTPIAGTVGGAVTGPGSGAPTTGG